MFLCSVQSPLPKLRACNIICYSFATEDCPKRHNNVPLVPGASHGIRRLTWRLAWRHAWRLAPSMAPKAKL